MDTKDVRYAVLNHLAHIRLMPQCASYSSSAEKGMIFVEPEGVRINLDMFWRDQNNPLVVVSILKLLDVPLLNLEEVVTWVKRQQHPKGYFVAGKLGRNVREATYQACAILRLGGAIEEGDWDRVKLVTLLRAQQQPKQRRHFAFLPDDTQSYYAELKVAFYCIGSLAALGETAPHLETAVHYLQAKQDKSGAIKTGWVKQRPYSLQCATFDVIRTLHLLNARLQSEQTSISTIQAWQIADGGFTTTYSRDPHYIPRSWLHDTALSIFALYLLGAEPSDKTTCTEFISHLWLPTEGIFRNTLDESAITGASIIPTHLGLFAAAVLGMLHPLPVNLQDLIIYGINC